MTQRDRNIGLTLIALGALLLFSNLFGVGSGWIWLAVISAVFLYAHRSRHEPGLAVPGGILAGIALGVLLEGMLPVDGVFLFGLAAGFYLVRTLEPRIHEWAIWPAGILAAIAAAITLTSNTWLLVLVLLGAGVFLLGRNHPAKHQERDAQMIHADRPASNLDVPLEEEERPRV